MARHWLGSGIMLAVPILVLSLTASGESRAEPPLGTFKVKLSDGNRVYTFGKDRKEIPDLGEGSRCDRPKGGLSGTLKAKCEIRIDDSGLKGKLKGPLEVYFSGDGGDKEAGLSANLQGRLEENGQQGNVKWKVKGSEVFTDGDPRVKVPIKLKVCVEGSCRITRDTIKLKFKDAEGLWKVRLDVKEKEPGVLGGKALALLYKEKLRYRIVGSYDSTAGTSAIELQAEEKPKHNQIDLSDVRVEEGRVTGRIAYDLFGQTGSTDFDVPLAPAS